MKADPEVVCVIVTGAGERAFCTGMDIGDVADGSARSTGMLARSESPWFRLTALQNRCWKPVITAVNGMACGGGLHFVADSDLVIVLGDGELLRHPREGGPDRRPRAGRARAAHAARGGAAHGAARWLRAHRRAPGARASVWSARCCRPIGCCRAPASWPAKIAEHSPTALARSKQAIWESLDVGLDEALGRTWKLINEHTAHPDLHEGSRAFVEKRRPRWAPYTE